MKHWSAEAFARRSRLQWQCIDCSGACSLDEALAEHVQKLVEAKQEQDGKDQELRQVVSPHLAARAAVGVSQEELGLADKLLRSRDKFASVSGMTIKLLRHAQKLKAKHEELLRKAFFKAYDGRREQPSPHLRVEQLLQQKADPSSPDRLGRTALMVAAFSGHLKVVEALLNSGAQLEAREEGGRTALTIAATSGAKQGHLNVLAALLKGGVSPEGRDERGRTALVSAAGQGLENVVEFLVRAGAQLEARDESGNTALTLAAKNGYVEVVEVLLKAGAQVEARDEHGDTALMSAAADGHAKVVEALVKAGAQLEASSGGGTALTVAAKFGRLRVVEALLKVGAQLDLEARDKTGKTALMSAAFNKFPEVVQVLVEVEIPGPAQRNPFRIHASAAESLRAAGRGGISRAPRSRRGCAAGWPSEHR
ncbi:unnamed protein product [Symbiodinium sp. CCMP2456]|nr:unnamed protein product [Symbiodinium sp. CCMP2456]